MSDPLKPSRLRTNARETPLGTDVESATFRWLVPETVGTQTAYRIRLAADPANLPAGEGRWDSDAVSTDESTGVPYTGPPLDPRTRYYWTVAVRDGDGSWSDWAEPTWFETGLDEWRGSWIAPAGNQYETTPAPAPVFRRTIELDRAVESARLYVAAGGCCDPRINGERVTDSVLDPGQTDYEERVLFATYDVTDALQSGENALAIVCGRERYAMTTQSVWAWHESPWQRDHPELLAELDVTLVDGTGLTVGSNGDWRVAPSATQYDSLYAGEVYDAREAAAWSDTDLDDRTWERARTVEGPSGRLRPQQCQPIEPVRTVEPASITKPDVGVYVLDFGEMLAGWTRLSVEAPEGTKIQLTYGERLHDDGSVDVDQGHVDERLQTDRYVCAGDGEERWEPRFSYKGFRYVQVDGLPTTPTADTLTAVQVNTTVDAGSTSEFGCSDDVLESVHGNSVRAILNNYHSVPTDTPTYEKNGWTGDAQLTAEAALYNFDVEPFYRKWLADVADAQRSSGEIPPIAPTSDWGYSDAPHDGEIHGPNPAWDAAYVLLPWWTYRYCGTRDLLAEHYDGMQGVLRFLGTYVEDGVLDVGLGDWLSPGDGEVRTVPPEGPALTSTAYYYRLAEILNETAAVLGLEEDAASFAALADRTDEAFNDAFLDAAQGCYATGQTDEYRQTSNVLPLAFGLVPEIHREAVVENLVRDIQDAHDGHLNTGVLGTKYLLGVLCDHGYADLAYRVATRRSYPSWGHWIEHGATALYEAWELESRSRNHHMFGSVDEWFYKYLAGVRPAEPGFRSVTIEPHVPADLDWVDASVDTVRGVVASAWERTEGWYRFDLTIPPNTWGTARLPGTNPSIDGNPVADGAGASNVGRDDGRAVIELPPGEWTVRTVN